MASRKIQLLRSNTVYQTKAAAIASLNAELASNANLADGELVLARYQSSGTVKSVLGIYCNKGTNNTGWTVVQDTNEIVNILNDLDYSLNVLNATDSQSTLTTSDASKVVTAINQEDGQVAAGTTAVKDLVLTGYTPSGSNTGTVAATDTIAEAIDKIENELAAQSKNQVANSDGSITVTAPSGNDTTTDIKVHIKSGEKVIKLDSTNGIYTNLNVVKVLPSGTAGTNEVIDSNLATNIKEAYRLLDSDGNAVGQQINVYKDSALKEVYIGTKYDTVDSSGNSVPKTRIVNDGYKVIDATTYDGLSAFEKDMYEQTPDDTTYTIKDEYATLTEGEYATLSSQISTVTYRLMNDADYQSLNFIYQLQDGTYEIVHVDLDHFILDAEIGSGLAISNGSVSVYTASGNAVQLMTVTGNQKRPVGLVLDGESLEQSSNGLKIKLDDTTTTSSQNAQYAGESTTEGGVETVVHNNILQITGDGLYLDSTWDCGEY